jgi:cell division protein FtsB
MLAKLSPRRKLVLGAFAASLCMAATSLGNPKGLRRLDRLRADIERQEQRNRELREENARLSKTVRELSPPIQPQALERAAREQLGFFRQDEVLFKFE